MKIKNTALLLLASLAISCSDIAEDERFTDAGPVAPQSAILIEDFTGQRCLNCPNATEVINTFHQAFGENIIAVAIYGGPFGKRPNGTYLPLTTETGDYYANQRNINEQPHGYFNRTTDETKPDNWAPYIKAELLKEASGVQLENTNNYDPNTQEVTVNVRVESSKEMTDTRLQVWLIEDNIVSMQMLPDGQIDQNYVHNHAFRTSVNDRDGEPVSLQANTPVNKSYKLTLDPSWNPAEKYGDMYIVAFVFNANGVQKVIKQPIASAPLAIPAKTIR